MGQNYKKKPFLDLIKSVNKMKLSYYHRFKMKKITMIIIIKAMKISFKLVISNLLKKVKTIKSKEVLLIELILIRVLSKMMK